MNTVSEECSGNFYESESASILYHPIRENHWPAVNILQYVGLWKLPRAIHLQPVGDVGVILIRKVGHEIT